IVTCGQRPIAMTNVLWPAAGNFVRALAFRTRLRFTEIRNRLHSRCAAQELPNRARGNVARDTPARPIDARTNVVGASRRLLTMDSVAEDEAATCALDHVIAVIRPGEEQMRLGPPTYPHLRHPLRPGIGHDSQIVCSKAGGEQFLLQDRQLYRGARAIQLA